MAFREFTGELDGSPSFDTALTPQEEVRFQAWKQRYAPKDSGEDYDLRGAFKANLKPDPQTGHWPDTFKKPNHPTFSNESKYAQFGTPGRWEGETYIPGQPASTFKEFTGELDSVEPSIGAVALNAVPKGVANFLNTPNLINSLVLKGVASLPGLDAVPDLKNFLTGLAEHPEFQRNRPMEFMKKIGAVRPENEPQTGPQRIVDTAIQAAIGSAAIPGGGPLNMAKQAAMGATSGIAAQGTKEATGSDLLAGVVGMATPFVVKAGADRLAKGSKQGLLTPTAKMTLQDAQQHGFVVEPSQVRQPTSKIETVAGKAAIAQGAVEKNQGIANRLAARALGLADDTPLSPELLKTYKNTVMQPYRDVDEIFKQLKQGGQLPYFPRYHSNSLMDEFVEAGQDAKALWKSYSRDPKIEILKAAKAADAHTDGVFQDIMLVANASGKPDLANKVLSARKLYARINDVESAMNVGTGNISMPTLAAMYDKGKPLSGELQTIAKFANAFPRSAREIERVPPSGVSGTDAAMSATLGLGGAAAAGSPTGLAAAGLPLLRGPARNYVLSEKYQQRLLKDPSFRFNLQIPKSAARTSAVITGKTVLDQREESD